MTQSWLSYITTQIRANPGVKLETILNKYGKFNIKRHFRFTIYLLLLYEFSKYK